MTAWPVSPKGQKGYHCTLVASTLHYLKVSFVIK
jgi:hypothetical protein